MLPMLVFDMYDTNGNESLEWSEAQQMIVEMYGDSKTTNRQANRFKDQIDRLGSLGIQKQFFTDFAKNHPSFIKPALNYQNKIQKFFFGKKYWKKISLIRNKLSNDTYESINVIIKRLGPKKRRKSIPSNEDSDSEDEGMSLDKLLKLKRKAGHSFNSSRTRTARRDSFSSDKNSDKGSEKNSERHSEEHSMRSAGVSSLVDSEPAKPKISPLTGKYRGTISRGSFCSENSLLDDDEHDKMDKILNESTEYAHIVKREIKRRKSMDHMKPKSSKSKLKSTNEGYDGSDESCSPLVRRSRSHSRRTFPAPDKY
eukprot:CAMPEP_0185032208 /NCGR_PEP_ID=MMETSP1103-20130426/20135_1 /TAXON_ID=36769 /ORGANISM="Paraphysomonas bandaiensis, Strain Caron Lab Isolate" /LENGTH=311 /DNA_ID=CAMNT_0027568019 /DNA_START=107 /DNA_END=1042 /DNA_ORIENTATION=+